MTAGPSVSTTRPTPGPAKRWVLGARPRTLPAAVVPVLVGTAAAHLLVSRLATGSPPSLWDSHWWRAVGALAVALALQIGTNYANDYS
ncbi:MAG: hypothetical protein ACRDWB_09435, partial [Acidimicrobiales bacterium]